VLHKQGFASLAELAEHNLSNEEMGALANALKFRVQAYAVNTSAFGQIVRTRYTGLEAARSSQESDAFLRQLGQIRNPARPVLVDQLIQKIAKRKQPGSA
jgi:hypothetical protein